MTEELTRSRKRVVGFEDQELDFQLLRQLASYGGATNAVMFDWLQETL